MHLAELRDDGVNYLELASVRGGTVDTLDVTAGNCNQRHAATRAQRLDPRLGPWQRRRFMAITTLGQLMHWLLHTPHTPLDTLRATNANPEDLAAAISLMMARNHLCEPVLVGGKMLFRTRATPQSLLILDLPIAGCHQLNPYRDQHRMQPWIDTAIAESAREWRRKPGAADDDPENAVRGEAFLSARLGRRPTDRESSMFWHVVDAPETMTG